MTPFEKYIHKLAFERTPFAESDYVVLNEDCFIPNILPRSGAGITLKAGVYIDGVCEGVFQHV
jgi:hypothetical protein